MNLADLAAPFPPEQIHWRAQTLTQDGSKALALAYLDARDVMDRLDSVCGPAGWQTAITETPSGRVLCALSILSDGHWITKTDGAGSTAVEGEKGGISDAIKRAAVLWGIGRYLYDIGNVWAPCEFKEYNSKKQWKAWKPEAKAIFARALGGAAPRLVEAPEGVISDDQLTELIDHMEARGLAPAALIAVANENLGTNISKVSDLPASAFAAALKWVTSQRKAA